MEYSTPPPLARGSAALNADQARRLQKELGRQLHYLQRMRERINKQRWPHDDAIAVALEPAIEAMQRLHFRALCLPGDLRQYNFVRGDGGGTVDTGVMTPND